MSSAATAAPGERPLAEIELLSGQNLWACYQCGKCTADCPFSLSPSLAVRLLQLGEVDEATRLATTWECASCFTCETGCPKGVSPYRILRTLRERASQAKPHRLRSRLLAVMPRLFRAGSRLGPLGPWLTRAPGVRTLGHAVLGLHRDRPVPPLARETFPAWFARHAPLGDGHRGPVLLFHDTFMDFVYPQVGIAATEVLERAGLRVELTDTVCCGRPAISKGHTAEAAVCARTNVERLYDAASRGVPIVGCEPSCLLSLRDEYLQLAGPDRERAQVVGGQALLIDEFLGRLAERGELELRFREKNGAPPVLFHGHCHQKAHGNPTKSLELLGLAGYEAEMIQAACCGMAGTYGYEREHYELSRAAGERALFPALREHESAQIAIMGASCRQQIEHFTGRPVRHVVELLREALA